MEAADGAHQRRLPAERRPAGGDGRRREPRHGGECGRRPVREDAGAHRPVRHRAACRRRSLLRPVRHDAAADRRVAADRELGDPRAGLRRQPGGGSQPARPVRRAVAGDGRRGATGDRLRLARATAVPDLGVHEFRPDRQRGAAVLALPDGRPAGRSARAAQADPGPAQTRLPGAAARRQSHRRRARHGAGTRLSRPITA